MFSPLRRTPFDYLTGTGSVQMSPAYHLMQIMGAVLPPQMTPVSMNPLHGLLSSLIDFERVRRCEEIRIYVPATNVRTGKANIFVRDELDARMLAASACLPQLFAAVEIDGEAYWDGSFVGNPELSPLVGGAHADDILILQNNPIVRSKLPLSPADIVNRASETSFNVGFMFELRAIAHAGALADEEHPDRRRASRVRLHMISGNELLSNLDISSKFNLEWPFILQLHEAGRKAAGDWLASSASQIGVRSTIESHLVDHPQRHAAGGASACGDAAASTTRSQRPHRRGACDRGVARGDVCTNCRARPRGPTRRAQASALYRLG